MLGRLKELKRTREDRASSSKKKGLDLPYFWSSSHTLLITETSLPNLGILSLAQVRKKLPCRSRFQSSEESTLP